MGWRRPHTLILGLVVVVVALGSQQTAGSQPVDTRVVDGAVSAAGTAPASPDWHVQHRGTGTYHVVVPGAEIDLDVPEWDQSADVTIVPLGRGTVEVRFTQGKQRVDTDFTFVALVHD